MLKSILVILTFFTIATVFAQGEVSFESAAKNYQTYCAGCHGEQMQAFVDRNWKFGNSADSLMATIRGGRADAGMPTFGEVFSEKEIKELSQYILSGIENVDRYWFTEKLVTGVFETKNFSFKLDTVFSGAEVPWGMAFLPNGAMLITDRSGDLYHIDAERQSAKVKNVPDVLAEGQGGLLDVAIHPNFESNQLVYLSYSGFKKEGNKTVSTTIVERAQLKGKELLNRKVILEALPYSTMRHHYGSRLQFDNKGLLYVSVGDRGNRDENPQSLDNHCGKIHRIKDDGTIPADNPFVNEKGAKSSIYSYGHRNEQGLAINPIDGQLWEHEHGPRGGDEINIIEKGKNYGWPVISYGLNYNGTTFTNLLEKEGMLQPVLYWVPSIAPSGMAFVTSDKYPGWEGQLLVGSLRFQYLNLCYINDGKVDREELLMEKIGRVRNVKVSADGYIYVAVENPGFVFRLQPIK